MTPPLHGPIRHRSPQKLPTSTGLAGKGLCKGQAERPSALGNCPPPKTPGRVPSGRHAWTGLGASGPRNTDREVRVSAFCPKVSWRLLRSARRFGVSHPRAT